MRLYGRVNPLKCVQKHLCFHHRSSLVLPNFQYVLMKGSCKPLSSMSNMEYIHKCLQKNVNSRQKQNGLNTKRLRNKYYLDLVCYVLLSSQRVTFTLNNTCITLGNSIYWCYWLSKFISITVNQIAHYVSYYRWIRILQRWIFICGRVLLYQHHHVSTI